MNKIRILYVLDTLNIGGMENCVIGLCNNIDYSKYEVSLLVLSKDNALLKSRLDSNVHLVLLPFYYSFIINVVGLFAVFPFITCHIRRIKPHIVHTNCYQLRLLSLQIACLFSFRRMKYVHSIHTSGLHYNNVTIKDRFKIFVESVMYRTMKISVVCVSSEIYEKVAKLFPKDVQFEVINNGVNTKIDIVKPCLSTDRTCVNLVYVSRIHSGKNHELLIFAFSEAIKKNENIRLYLLGDGVLKKEMLNLAIKLNVGDKVFFLGNRDDVLSILKSCHIGIFPSLFEGLSLALLEMMSVGLPIICSNISEFKMLFNDDEALFFDPSNSDDICRNILRLSADENLAHCLSKKSLSIVGNYSLEFMASQYSSLYQNKVR